jgi:hypothetical protein
MANISETLGLAGTTRASEVNNLQIDYEQTMQSFLFDGQSPAQRLFATSRGATFNGGQKKVWAAEVSRAASVGPRAEGSRLPRPTTGSVINLETIPRKVQMRGNITPEAKQHTGAGKAAFSSAEQRLYRSLTETMTAYMNRTHTWGRGAVLGVINGAPANASVANVNLTLHGRAAHAYTASRYFARGTLEDRGNVFEAEPFRVGQSIAFGTTSMLGSPLARGVATNAFNTGAPNDDSPTNEAVIRSIDTSTPESPVINIGRADGSNFNPNDFTGGVAALDGAAILEYGARRQTVDADSANAISDHLAMEGAASLAFGPIVYDAVYGVARTASIGLRAFINQAGGQQRLLTQRLLGNVIRRVTELQGRSGQSVFASWFQWNQFADQYEDRKLFQPVIGRMGTNVVGNDPVGFTFMASGNQVTFLCDVFAPPEAVWVMNSDDFEYLSDWPFRMTEELRITNYDQTEKWGTISGNARCKNIAQQAAVEDLLEDFFTISE